MDSNNRSPSRRRSPKHHQARERLRKLINDGKFPPGSRLPPETELPKSLDVSRQTVRRALNDLVREGVIVRVQGSGSYVADTRHPPILPGKNLRIGLLYRFELTPRSLRGGYLAEMTRGALREWGMEDVEPGFKSVGPREATQCVWRRPDRGIEVVGLGEPRKIVTRSPTMRSVTEGHFDGILTLSIIQEPWLSRVLDLNIPTVVSDYPGNLLASRSDQVFVDPMAGYGLAVKHFLDRGYRNFHFLGAAGWATDPEREVPVEEWQALRKQRSLRIDPDSLLRLTACRHAMTAAGHEWPDLRVHFQRNYSGAIQEVTEKLMSLEPQERPEVVIGHSVSDIEALTDRLSSCGHTIVGAGAVDHWNWRGKTLPVVSDMREVGAAAAALLVSRLQRPSRPYFNVGVRMTFVEEEKSGTTAPPVATEAAGTKS